MSRAPLAVLSLAASVVAVCLSACGDKGSDAAPSAPTTVTRTIVLSGTLAFGDVLGGSSRELSFMISNSGTATLTVSGITGPAGYVPNWTTGTLAPGSTQTVAVSFTPTVDQTYSGALTIASDATSGTNSISVSGRGMRTGHVIDAAGDARALAGVAMSPDLVDAALSAAGGVLSITLSFAPGTLSQSDTAPVVYLDVDENPGSGRPGTDSAESDASVIGVEYSVLLVDARGGSRATVTRMRLSGGTWFADTVGMVEVTFPGANQVRANIPLSLVGNDDGRLAFKVVADQWRLGVLGDVQRSAHLDIMPDTGAVAGLTQ